MPLKICPNCHRGCLENNEYCPTCKTKLSIKSDEVQPLIPPQQPVTQKTAQISISNPSAIPVSANFPKPKSHNWIVILLVVFLLLFFISLVYQSPPSTSSQSTGAVQNTITLQQTITSQITSAAQYNYSKNMRTLREIAYDYANEHPYNAAAGNVCLEMARGVWYIVETHGINAKVTLGNVDDPTPSINNVNHAWVKAEVAPDQWIAIETTGGYLVCPDTNYCPINNPLYFKGWDYSDPLNMQFNMCGKGVCPSGTICDGNIRCEYCPSGEHPISNWQCGT